MEVMYAFELNKSALLFFTVAFLYVIGREREVERSRERERTREKVGRVDAGDVNKQLCYLFFSFPEITF